MTSREAARYREYRLEDYVELEAAGEEGLERPQSLEEAKGRWLSKALPEVSEIIQALRPGSRACRIMETAAKQLVLSRRRKPHAPTGGVWKNLAELVHSPVHNPRLPCERYGMQGICMRRRILDKRRRRALSRVLYRHAFLHEAKAA